MIRRYSKRRMNEGYGNHKLNQSIQQLERALYYYKQLNNELDRKLSGLNSDDIEDILTRTMDETGKYHNEIEDKLIKSISRVTLDLMDYNEFIETEAYFAR